VCTALLPFSALQHQQLQGNTAGQGALEKGILKSYSLFHLDKMGDMFYHVTSDFAIPVNESGRFT